MDLNHLEIFCKIYECSSFSKAGQALCLTQPTISSHMKKLEEALQTKLFDRLGREIVPTRAGEHLYRYAREIVRLKEEAGQTLDQLKGNLSGTLNIGGSTIPGEYILPSFVSRFRKMHSGVIVNLRIGDSHDVVNMVSERTVELAVIGAPTNNASIECRELWKDELLLIAPPSFGARKVSMENFRKVPLIFRERGSGTRASFEKAIEEFGLRMGDLNIVGEMGSTEAIKGAIRAEMGLSVLSSLAVQDDLTRGTLKKIDVPGLPISRNFYIITHRLRDKGLPYQAFVDMLFAKEK